jgi:predicted hydrocarbon binding protein
MAEVKGVLLNAWMLFLRERYGERAVAEAMTHLRAEEQAALASPFLISSWYPFNTLFALGSLTRELGGSERGLSFEIGRFMARRAFGEIYRQQLAKDPITQLQKFAWVHDLLYRQAREKEVEISGPSSGVIRYRYQGEARPFPGFCSSHSGFWVEVLQMAGANRVRASHPKCAAKGDDCCEFRFEW